MLTVLAIFATLLAAAPHSTTVPVPNGALAVQRAAWVPTDNPCSIRSNAGNCYSAGEYCRRTDLGQSTTDADGQTIACVMESGRPHWHHS